MVFMDLKQRAVPHRGALSLFVPAANTWYNLRDAYIVRFVVGGCRKNLPLCVAAKEIHP